MFILNNISGVCSDPGLAAIISLIKKAMNIVWIIGPILAMIGAVIAFTKMMSNPDEKKYKTLFKNMIIALLMLFFLPVIVNTVMKLFDDSFEVSACWNQAENINNTGSQGSNYIDPGDDRPSSDIYTDPDDYETGTPPTSSSSSSSGVVTGSGESSFTSTKNKIRYNVYSQNDSRWASVQYSSGSTIGSVGCMITSVAVVSSANDTSITPKTVFDSKYRNSYPRDGVGNLSGGAFSCVNGSTSSDSIKNALNNGNVVIIKVYGSKKGGKSSYTTSQHYMALLDINGSQVYIGNGYSTSGRGATGWHNVNDVLTSVQTADYCTPTQALLSKYS